MDDVMRGLWRYLAGRLGILAGSLLLLSIIVFAAVDLVPGDPVTARLGDQATVERVAEARSRLGLDDAAPVRYLTWVTGLFRGDLGASLITDVPVRSLIGDRIGNSLLLAALTVVLVVPLSLAFGLWAGLRRGSRSDRAISGAAVMLVALPEYVMASLMILLFAVTLRWLPAVSITPSGRSPLATPSLLVLPVLSLLTLSLAHSVRVIRAAAAAAVQAPFVGTARLNGVPETTVVRRAVLPAVLPVAAQIWCVLAVGLIGGAVLVERVYGYPGIGELLVAAVQAGDLPVAQAIAMLLGAATLVAVTLADVVVGVAIPARRSSW